QVVDELGADDAAAGHWVGLDHARVVEPRQADHRELATVEQQGFLIAAHVGLGYLPELEDVVTSVVGLPWAAPECRQSALKYRGQAVGGGLPGPPQGG